MSRRQPLPRLWMMTDERQGEALWTAIGRLPLGSGIIFRHYSLPQAERRRLFQKVRRVARGRGILILLAGPPALARAWRADGSHHRGKEVSRGGLRSAPVHNAKELVAARRAGADLVFVSPVFVTRSHPGGRPLGPIRFGLLAAQATIPVIALGGVGARHWPGLRALHAYGWAAIDHWAETPDQKRKAVPT